MSPGARFRGVSKALIGRLEARALEFGVRTVTLESRGNRPRVHLSGAWTTDMFVEAVYASLKQPAKNLSARQ